MKLLFERKILSVLIAGLIVATLGWHWSNENDLLRQEQTAEDTNNPDAFVVEGRYRMFRENGALATVLVSERAVHYPHDNTGHLQNPQVDLFQRDGRPWHIESKTGIMDMNSDVITLQQDVVVQSLDQDQQPVTMTTEQLILNNQTHFITTDRPVKIASQQAETTAVGLDAYVDEKRMILKSRVRGSYVPPSP